MKLKQISKWEEIYKYNRTLDEIFIAKYQSPANDMYAKNCIEFLVEIGEFVNETRCFKYWSIKTPDKALMLEEYADCLTMLLSFYGTFLNTPPNFSLITYSKEDNIDIMSLINNLYEDVAKILNNLSLPLLNKIFQMLLILAYSLNLNENEILEALNQKQLKVKERLEDELY